MSLQHGVALAVLATGGAFQPPRPRIGASVRLRSSSFEKAKEEFLSEAELDVLSLRSWRRETLIRYNNANQSEPLRILLFGLLALSLAGCVAIADAIGAPVPQGPELAAYYGGAVGSSLLFNRERGKRTKRLLKIERECAVGDLRVTLRPSAAAFPGATRTASLRQLRNDFRVVAALCADDESFDAFHRTVQGLRRRLATSKVLALAVRGDRVDALAGCSPLDTKAWRETFGALLTTDAAWGDFDFESKDAAWLALSFAGRSVGSGVGSPDFVQLLGSLLPPRDFVEAEPPLGDATALEAAQKRFYDALRSGDEAAMADVFGDDRAPSVDDALAAGARLDPWASQLADGARPADLKVGDADATEFDNGEAITTAVEETAPGQTLVAVQRWVKDGEGHWRLKSHETIPFAPNVRAGAVLYCDARGCVALTRSQQPRDRD